MERRGDRTAIVVGFRTGLADAIVSTLHSRGFTVRQANSPAVALALHQQRNSDVILCSGALDVDAVLELVESLGRPRSTRVVVLLPGNLPEVRSRYTAAGVRVVLTMPAGTDVLIRAATEKLPPHP